MDDLFADIHRTIDRHGWHAQAVLADTPDAPTWTYTVGLHEAGRPELIVFGEPPRCAHEILTQVRETILQDPAKARGGVDLGELASRHGPRRARLGRVHPRWVAEFPLLALGVYGPDVEVLQVVLANDLGAFWDDPDYDVSVGWDHLQPDLSRLDRPWRTPIWAYGWVGDGVAPDLWVLVPVTQDGVSEHRDEALPAARLDRSRARILQPAILADHLTADAEVTIEPEPDGVLTAAWPRVTAPTHRLATIDDPGHRVALSYAFAPHDRWEDHRFDDLEAVFERFDAIGSFGTGTVHLAVPSRQAEQVRIAMRRLERDGLLTALPPYHAPPAYRDHPGCPACRRARP